MVARGQTEDHCEGLLGDERLSVACQHFCAPAPEARERSQAILGANQRLEVNGKTV